MKKKIQLHRETLQRLEGVMLSKVPGGSIKATNCGLCGGETYGNTCAC